MIFWFGLFLFLFGLAVGSFLNVIIYRSNNPLPRHYRGKRVKFGGRSFCPKCKKMIVWYDNLPLISFLLLQGKCRRCHSPISRQYPLVELATGLVFLAVWWRFMGGLLLPSTNSIFSLVYQLTMAAIMIGVFVSDFLYMTIPEELVWPGIAISFSYSLLGGFHIFWPGLLAGAISGLFFLSLVVLTRGKGMGVGDVKLALLMGLFLGYPLTVIALYAAFLTGAAWGVILILSGRKRFGQTLPFGPFLVLGTGLAFFAGEQIWSKIAPVLPW